MNQRQFLAVWMRLRPRSTSRAKHMHLGTVVYESFGSFRLLLADPKFWWFVRRVNLALRYGFPMPLTDRQRGRFYA